MSRSFFPNRSGNVLPVSTTTTTRSNSKEEEDGGGGGGGIRRRLSSSSLNNISAAAAATANWSFPRSKSLSFSSVGESIRNWWLWIFAWRKPVFATDLEMKLLNSHDRPSFKHVFYRMRSEIKRFTNSHHSHLPQTYKQ